MKLMADLNYDRSRKVDPWHKVSYDSMSHIRRCLGKMYLDNDDRNDRNLFDLMLDIDMELMYRRKHHLMGSMSPDSCENEFPKQTISDIIDLFREQRLAVGTFKHMSDEVFKNACDELSAIRSEIV
jgi:hypothetical protein